MLVILIFSPGMFIASTAYLPSSFSMYVPISVTRYMNNQHYFLLSN